MVQVGADGRILYASPSVRRLGYGPEALTGKFGLDLFHPDDQPRLTEAVSALERGEAAGEMDRLYRLRTASGDWARVEGGPRLMLSDKVEPRGFAMLFRDVADWHRLEEEAHQQQDLFEAAFEHSAVGRVLLDMTGRIVRVNRSICHTLGYAPAELIGRADNDVAHPDEIDQFADQFAAVMRGDISSYQVERRYLRRDGGWVWFSLIVSMARNLDGSPRVIVGDLQDLTERHATEAELRRKRAEAEAATVAKTEFLANMSHELRTPLTGIIGLGGLLESMQGLPDRARAYVGHLMTGAEALLSIVNNILDFTKLEAGQVQLDPRPFDPIALVDEALLSVRFEAGKKGLELRTVCNAPLPPTLCADSARIRQVLLNLLGNAVKFTPKGEVVVHLSLEAGDVERLLFQVTDTGIGIPSALSHRLFQRFSQIDGSISRQYGGTGLGLAISKGLVETMGGEIGMRSEEGLGSTFWFTVPVA